MYHRPFETTEASSSLATTITRLVKTTEELTAFPTGHNMFMESSYPIKLIDKERLLSPYFPATTGGLCFAIWYHMFGVVGYNQVGRLKIYIEKIGQKDTIPQKAELDVFGNQGEGWIKGQFPVGERKTYFKFIIEGTKLKDYLGDIFVNNPKLYNCSDGLFILLFGDSSIEFHSVKVIWKYCNTSKSIARCDEAFWYIFHSFLAKFTVDEFIFMGINFRGKKGKLVCSRILNFVILPRSVCLGVNRIFDVMHTNQRCIHTWCCRTSLLQRTWCCRTSLLQWLCSTQQFN
ncbi:uncharacterized protein [Mytilus edulis]|uniref:uncharacterized protein n=1 Tax=Mytilus edulis TaxID=6550 RepID=UPI0039F0DC80